MERGPLGLHSKREDRNGPGVRKRQQDTVVDVLWPKTSVVTRAERLRPFITDADPPIGSVVEVLCEDHVGTYRPP
jgi:hypothetical protein